MLFEFPTTPSTSKNNSFKYSMKNSLSICLKCDLGSILIRGEAVQVPSLREGIHEEGTPHYTQPDPHRYILFLIVPLESCATWNTSLRWRKFFVNGNEKFQPFLKFLEIPTEKVGMFLMTIIRYCSAHILTWNAFSLPILDSFKNEQKHSQNRHQRARVRTQEHIHKIWFSTSFFCLNCDVFSLGERPWSCVVCGKGFMRKELLTYHNRIHTGTQADRCLLLSVYGIVEYICHLEHDSSRKVYTGSLNSKNIERFGP